MFFLFFVELLFGSKFESFEIWYRHRTPFIGYFVDGQPFAAWIKNVWNHETEKPFKTFLVWWKIIHPMVQLVLWVPVVWIPMGSPENERDWLLLRAIPIRIPKPPTAPNHRAPNHQVESSYPNLCSVSFWRKVAQIDPWGDFFDVIFFCWVFFFGRWFQIDFSNFHPENWGKKIQFDLRIFFR